MTREMTTEEIRDKFLKMVRDIVKYWEDLPDDREGKVFSKTEGVAFTILSLIDGENASFPSFILAPDPHPSDKKFHEEEGSDYFPCNSRSKIKGNISGQLHDEFYTPEM